MLTGCGRGKKAKARAEPASPHRARAEPVCRARAAPSPRAHEPAQSVGPAGPRKLAFTRVPLPVILRITLHAASQLN